MGLFEFDIANSKLCNLILPGRAAMRNVISVVLEYMPQSTDIKEDCKIKAFSFE